MKNFRRSAAVLILSLVLGISAAHRLVVWADTGLHLKNSDQRAEVRTTEALQIHHIRSMNFSTE